MNAEVKQLQKMILTKYMSYYTKDGYLNSNIFYKASDQMIKKHYEKAKEIYKLLFKSFLFGWAMDGYKNLLVVPGIEELTLYDE